METQKLTKTGKILLAAVLVSLLALVIFNAGCGGGGGGTTAVTNDDTDYERPSVSATFSPDKTTYSSGDVVNIYPSMSTTSGGDLYYKISSDDNSITASWKKYVSGAKVEWKATSEVASKEVEITITAKNKFDNERAIPYTKKVTNAAPDPVDNAPYIDSVTCSPSTINSGGTTYCNGNFSDAQYLSSTCLVKCGDQPEESEPKCTDKVSCKFDNTTGKDIIQRVSFQPVLNGKTGNTKYFDVVVEKTSSTADRPGLPLLANPSNVVEMDENETPIHVKVKEVVNDKSITLTGTVPGSCKSFWVKVGTSTTAKSVSFDSRYLNFSYSATSMKEGWNSYRFYCKGDENAIGDELQVESRNDSIDPDPPDTDAIPLTICATEYKVEGDVDTDCNLYVQGETDPIIEATTEVPTTITTAFDYTFDTPTDNHVYTWKIWCEDDAGNPSEDHYIRLETDCEDDGGGGDDDSGTECNNDGTCDDDESYSSCPNDCDEDDGIEPIYSYDIDSAATRLAYDSVNGNGVYYIESGRLYRKDMPSGNLTGSWRLDNQGTLGIPAIITDITGMAVGNNKLFIADGGTKLVYALNIVGTTSLTYAYIAGSGMNISDLGGIDYYNSKLYAVDSSSNSRVLVFNTSNGSQSLTFGTAGNDEGELSSTLRDITVDGSRGIIYIADNGNRKIVAFDLDGTFLREKTGLPLIGTLKARNISSLESLLAFTDASGYRAYGYTDNGAISWLWNLSSNSQNGSFQNALNVSWNSSTNPNSNGQLLISDSTKGKTQIFTLQQ